MPNSPGLFTLDSNEWDSIVQVLGSNFTTTSSTLVNITGLTFSAAINSLYEVEVVLKAQSSDVNGMRWSLACSATGSTGDYILISHSAQATTTGKSDDQALGVDNGLSKISYANLDGIVIYRSTITTIGNTGNITVQVRKVVAGTATIYIGSVMKIKKLA